MRAFFKGFGIAAAAAMMTVTTAASAQAIAPASEAFDDGSALHSDVSGTTIVEIGILAALVVIVLVATRGNGNGNGSSPASP